MRLVSFVIAGTQKGGTTALASYLRSHDAVCMTERKEAHFFDRDRHFYGARANYVYYHSLFRPQPKHRLLGDVTPIYMYWYDAPRRIWQYNPNMKIILLLRNPVDRAYSHWNMERARERESLSFWDAIRQENERCREALPAQHRVYSYVSRGFYPDQIRRLWTYFDRDQTLIMKSDVLRKAPQRTLDTVCDFLGIDRLTNVQPADVHSTPYLEPIGDRERQYLQRIYEYSIKDLERLLAWDCSEWLE